MTLIVPWVVFSRYVIGKTPAWGEEAALLCMVWFGFISMALGVRDNLHISIDVFDRILPYSFKYWTDWFKRILILAFGIFMLIEGLNMSEVALGNDLPGMGISSAFLYAIVPLAGIAIIYYIILDGLKTIRGAKEGMR
jgi:TRAP-type C4-dicarboxylate transport system permease small subunit